jgi:transcriptional regulator with XRE-family HTH domain
VTGFAKRLRSLRGLRGLSQTQLAKACGWNCQARISHYENGVNEPGLNDLKVLALALGISPASFFDEKSIADSLPTAIRNARLELGHTQQQLASQLEVSRNAVTEWETGASRPELHRFAWLLRQLKQRGLGGAVEELISAAAESRPVAK